MFSIEPMTMEHFEQVMALWKVTEGMGISRADTPERIAAFLARNPGLSQVAFDEQGSLAAAALCGHDGRRGYLHHVAVRADCRGQGLGRQVVEHCLGLLRAEGIDKCHLFVVAGNHGGRAFWTATGWRERTELVMMSRDL